MNRDISSALQEQVQEALSRRRPLKIVGGGSKHLLQAAAAADMLEVGAHSGIIAYEPGELFITTRAGTPLLAIEKLLAEAKQMLACEPPHFDDGSARATLGGTLACGFSGPRRPYAGSLRDHVLGVKLLNGEAKILQFGGQVMKNVAGFDIPRLMVGARGTLGVLLEVTLKVLPQAECEQTLSLQCPLADAPRRMSALARRPFPLSGLAWVGGQVFIRLAGSEAAIRDAHMQIGGELAAGGAQFWQSLREQTHAFFKSDRPLWKLSVPPATDIAMSENELFMDWGGALRWYHDARPPRELEAMVSAQGGHASLFRARDPVAGAMPPAALLALHRRLKQAFDPHGLFNPGLLGVS